MNRYGRILLSGLFVLILALGSGAALAEENSRTIVLRDPVFQLEGEDVLALEGLSFTLSQLGGDQYLRLDAGDARLCRAWAARMDKFCSLWTAWMGCTRCPRLRLWPPGMCNRYPARSSGKTC